MEITNSIRRQILDLDSKRKRLEYGCWKAEGTKCVLDLLGHFELCFIAATREWLDSHTLPALDNDCVMALQPKQMERISRMDSAPPVVAVFRLPHYDLPVMSASTLYLALDAVQDPGNLGTIIRTADWFGIRDVFCSADTADAFAPKVVMATMGALARVRVHYCSLPDLLGGYEGKVYGTFLDGENLYGSRIDAGGVIVMGNEGRGVSAAVESCCTRRLRIPSFPPGVLTSESLNVATATAITVAEFRRREEYGSICK